MGKIVGLILQNINPDKDTQEDANSKDDSQKDDSLEELKYEELKALAKERNIDGYTKMKKEDLIKALGGSE